MVNVSHLPLGAVLLQGLDMSVCFKPLLCEAVAVSLCPVRFVVSHLKTTIHSYALMLAEETFAFQKGSGS